MVATKYAKSNRRQHISPESRKGVKLFQNLISPRVWVTRLMAVITLTLSSLGLCNVALGAPTFDWVQQHSGTVKNLANIIFGGGQYVAVGAAGAILTSPDGVVWTSRSSNVIDDLALITYGNSVYVIAGSSYVLTSNDAINWEKHQVNWCNAQSNCGSTSSIAFGNGIFVAVGGTGVYNIQVSTDGINWNYVGTGEAPGNPNFLGFNWGSTLYGWTSVAYGNGRFVAVGDHGMITTSVDGINWTVVQQSGANLWSVAYGPSAGFVAVGDNETLLASQDGINWASVYSGSFYNWSGLGYGGGWYVFEDGGWGKMFIYNYNLKNIWTNGPGYNGIAYGNGKFVIVGHSGYIASGQISQPTVPDSPIDVSATPLNAQARVNFTAPLNDGGSAITSYTATCSANGQTTRAATGTSSPITVIGLTNGVAYTCSVSAENAVGSGPASTGSTVTPDGSGHVLEDCLFNWAERSYPQLFSPAGVASASLPPYYYRYYSGTGNYLATSSADNQIGRAHV